MQEGWLSLQAKKCLMTMIEGILLGHKISHKGIKVDYDKIAILLALDIPINFKELRGFLGCSRYYRRFVEAYLLMAAPLT
jgi:hypothetical protein